MDRIILQSAAPGAWCFWWWWCYESGNKRTPKECHLVLCQIGLLSNTEDTKWRHHQNRRKWKWNSSFLAPPPPASSEQGRVCLMKKPPRGWCISFMTTIWLCPGSWRDNRGRDFRQNCFNHKNESYERRGFGMGSSWRASRSGAGVGDDDDDGVKIVSRYWMAWAFPRDELGLYRCQRFIAWW